MNKLWERHPFIAGILVVVVFVFLVPILGNLTIMYFDWVNHLFGN